MKYFKEKLFILLFKVITIISLMLLLFILFFIFRESINFFKEVSFLKFISGVRWDPLGGREFSILNMILATIYISLLALFIALPIGVGFSVLLAVYIRGNLKRILKSLIDIIAGIPSVIYGFIGLLVLIKFFEEKFDFASGESVLAGGIVLSIMILPFIISTCGESMEKLYDEYLDSSYALGVSKSYMIRNLILPSSKKSILAATVLALGRGMGETMAVMMVIGNAPISPKLLSKAQTIPSLIALEMGMAGVDSLHYHALFASGFVLMLILLIINIVLYFIKKELKF